MRVATVSYAEIAEKLKHEKGLIAYLPIGCTEQHGPILPLGTDSIIAERIACDLCEINEKNGFPGLVYPVITYSPSASNQDYSGSTSVGEDFFRHYVMDVITSIMYHPFRALVLVCMHGPAEPSLIEIAFRLNHTQFDRKDRIRPLIVLGISACTDIFYRHLGRMIGKHADFREFLLLYHVMGANFFSEEKINLLRLLGICYRTTPPPPFNILGVPMRLRSYDGIIGSPWPEKEKEFTFLAENLWNDILDIFSSNTINTFSEFNHI